MRNLKTTTTTKSVYKEFPVLCLPLAPQVLEEFLSTFNPIFKVLTWTHYDDQHPVDLIVQLWVKHRIGLAEANVQIPIRPAIFMFSLANA